MPTSIKDETILLREAIKEILESAVQPLTCLEIADCYPVRSLGMTSDQVSNELFRMAIRKEQLFPLARVRHVGPGKTKWAYYNPTVCRPNVVHKPVAKPAPATVEGVHPASGLITQPEVNGVNSSFEFNPDEFVNPMPDAATHTAPALLRVPGVKGITITVGGVSIRVDLLQ